jgi:thiol-disulfide isomerase/thioredoxin
MSFLMVKQMVAQQSAKHTNDVLQEAYRQAAAENKNVFVMFHASWCGWCHKMDSSLNDKSIKAFFDKNYVITHLTVYESKDKKDLENPGALEFLTKYKGNDVGIPYWIIADKNGKWLADSQIRPDGSDYSIAGENVGFPASREEVNHFLKVLGKTSTLNASELSVIEKKFLLNR